MLNQVNHVAVQVLIASAASPGLGTRFVEYVNSRTYRCRVSNVEIFNRQTYLRTGSRLAFRWIERKMKVRPFMPGDLGVPSADPSIVDPIISRMEIETESISVHSRRTVQVGNLQDHGNQPTVLGHFRLPSEVFSDRLYALESTRTMTCDGRPAGIP